MPTDLTTNNVPFTTPIGTTPFTVDVTNCNLMADLTVKDFVIIVNGSVNPNSNWTKTSRTVLTYTGVAFGSALASEVRRNTPATRVQEITFANKFNSALWEEEMNRGSRRAYEYALNGVGPSFAGVSYVPINAAYNYATWSADNVQTATRSAMAGILSTLAPLNAPTLVNPVVGTQSDADNSTLASSTAWVRTRIANTLSNSPALGGNPTGVTAADNDNDTSLATTAHVKNQHSRFLAVRVTSDQALTVTATNTLIYNSETYDTDNQYDPATGIFTCSKPGIWLFTYSAAFSYTSSGGSTFMFYDSLFSYNNGATIYQGSRMSDNLAGASVLTGNMNVGTGALFIQMNNGDTMRITGFPDFNGSGRSVVNKIASYFSGARLLAL